MSALTAVVSVIVGALVMLSAGGPAVSAGRLRVVITSEDASRGAVGRSAARGPVAPPTAGDNAKWVSRPGATPSAADPSIDTISVTIEPRDRVPMVAEHSNVSPVTAPRPTIAPGRTVGQPEPDPLTVAVVGDSMFAVGAEIIRSVLEHTDGTELVHWEAISGRAISDHPTALSASADVIVTSFAYNDLAIHGWPETRGWLVRFLEAHAGSQIVWVRFDALASQEMVDYYEWLTDRAETLESLHIIDFSGPHRGQETWTCGTPCGGLGFHLEPGNGGVAVMASMIRSQLEQLARAQ